MACKSGLKTQFIVYYQRLRRDGGGDEIRTHDRFDPMPAFQASALNRSATPPHYKKYDAAQINCLGDKTQAKILRLLSMLPITNFPFKK